MKRKNGIKGFWSAATLALCLAWVASPAWSESRWPPIRTTTGIITSIGEGSEVFLYGTMAFQPSFEALDAYPSGRQGIPEWVKPNTQVSISYYEDGGRRYFLDIARPGGPFPVKESVEEERRSWSLG